MSTRSCILLLLAALTAMPAFGQGWLPEPTGIYVMPFYDSRESPHRDGPSITVGGFSDELATDDLDELRAVAERMKAQWSTLRIEAMYVAAIRFYDLGARRDATYWFYAAQFRARLFGGAVSQRAAKKFLSREYNRVQAFGAFHELAGQFINGAAYCDKEEMLSVLAEVLEDSARLPQLKAAYPDLRLKESAVKRNYQDIADGMREYAKRLDEGEFERAAAIRRENGMHERFCVAPEPAPKPAAKPAPEPKVAPIPPPTARPISESPLTLAFRFFGDSWSIGFKQAPTFDVYYRPIEVVKFTRMDETYFTIPYSTKPQWILFEYQEAGGERQGPFSLLVDPTSRCRGNCGRLSRRCSATTGSAFTCVEGMIRGSGCTGTRSSTIAAA